MDYIQRFNLDGLKFNNQMLACMVLIWAAVLGCALASLNEQPMTRKQRLFWIVLITGFPMIGVLLYLPFSFRLESYPSLNLLKRSK
jgi:hypothetical protein